jgi:YbbR domain-containing protein
MSTMARIPLLILSFILSILLWVYVQVQENPPKQPKTSYSVRVEIRNLPSTMEMPKINPLRVFPQGTADELARIDDKDISAYVDLANADPGTKDYPVHLVVKGDYNVRWDPAPDDRKVTITLEKTTKKAIPVRVQVVGSLSNPDYLYLPDSTYVDPPLILIIGPESDVSRVYYARAILDLTNVSPGKTYQSDIELLEKNDRPAQDTVRIDSEDEKSGNPASPVHTTRVTIHPSVAVGLETRSFHIQPTYRGLPAPGFVVKEIQVSPENVPVRGRTITLSAMSVVRTEDVDISGLKETKQFTVNPRLPDDVSVTSPQVIYVTVVIERVAATTAIPKNPAKTSPRKGG